MQLKERQLKFLFVTADEYPTFRPDVEILFAKYFKARGYEIDWVVRSFDGKQEGHVKWHDCNVWVSRTDTGSTRWARLRKHYFSFVNEIRAFSQVRERAYDVVQVKDKFIAALFGLLTARLNRKKFVYWLSFPYPEASFLQAQTEGARYPVFYRLRGMLFHLLLYKIICPFSDVVVVQSEEMIKQMSSKGANKEKMVALPMGVDQSILDFRLSQNNESKTQDIVYLGALDRIRHLEVLVEAFSRISEKYPETRLVFVGDSEDSRDKAFLQSEAERLGVGERVFFTGFLPRNEALEYVARATVCASPVPRGPTFDVSSPTKTLEYMALGKAVVANDIPDTKQVLEESQGGICVKFDPDDFAQAIAWILDNPTYVPEMGRRARQYIAEHRTYEKLADQMEAYYLKHLFDGEKQTS